jgi:hypothetical protein
MAAIHGVLFQSCTKTFGRKARRVTAASSAAMAPCCGTIPWPNVGILASYQISGCRKHGSNIGTTLLDEGSIEWSLAIDSQCFLGECHLVGHTMTFAVSTGPKLKIFRPVIMPDAIFVVDGFVRKKWSAEYLFHHDAMFLALPRAASVTNPPIAVLVYPAFAVASRPVGAGLRAKSLSVFPTAAASGIGSPIVWS